MIMGDIRIISEYWCNLWEYSMEKRMNDLSELEYSSRPRIRPHLL